jgi:hypothetical protein
MRKWFLIRPAEAKGLDSYTFLTETAASEQNFILKWFLIRPTEAKRLKGDSHIFLCETAASE